MIEELKQDEIENLLKSQIVGRLACHADDLTYIVPMSYTYDGEYIYGHAYEGMKIMMMRKNPKVCFQADKMENMANWQSVIAWGEFEELKKTSERKQALQKLMDRILPMISSETVHLSPNWPFPASEINSIKGVVFRIKVQKKTGRFEKSTTGTFFAS
jgi:hypothetical protein